jgi:hypothetical protein
MNAGTNKEFHVVLDSIDLGLLFEVLERAYGKDKTLSKFLSESNLPRLGV